MASTINPNALQYHPSVGPLVHDLRREFIKVKAELELGGSFTAQGEGAISRTTQDRLIETVNVKDYGAKADGVQVTSAITIASGNPNLLTVAGATFTAEDVGKRIFVTGIGSAGAPLNTTISGYVSATQVTLTAAASTFLTAASRLVTYGTEDSAAIALAIAYVRTLPTTSNGNNICLEFPAGIYILLSSIDLTSIRGIYLKGIGAALYGATGGKPIVDAMGTYGMHVEGFVLLGDQGSPPNVGWQLGRYHSGLQAFGRNYYRELTSYGYFTLAGLYCMASETSLFELVNLNNSSTNAYAMISDGCNHFGLTSEFVTVALAANTAFTNTVATFIQCKFVAQAAGSNAIWISNANAHRYENCYFNAPISGVVIYSTSLIRSNDVHFSGTIEGPPQNNFYFDGSGSSTLAGFSFSTCANVATVSNFNNNAALTAMKIFDAKCSMNGVNTGVTVFANPAIWTVYGDFAFSSLTDGWIPPGVFSGQVIIGTSGLTQYASLVQNGPGAMANRQRLTATGTHTIAATTGWLAMVQTGTVASVTLNLPTPVRDGQILHISTRSTLTALTLTPAAGTVGWTAGTTLGPNAGIAFGWDATSSHWNRIV